MGYIHIKDRIMDPILGPMISLIVQYGATAILVIGLFFLIKHHLEVLKDHKEQIKEIEAKFKSDMTIINQDRQELEKELRDKIEELLKDQLESQKPLTEALVEYNRLAKSLKPRRNDNDEKDR